MNLREWANRRVTDVVGSVGGWLMFAGIRWGIPLAHDVIIGATRTKWFGEKLLGGGKSIFGARLTTKEYAQLHMKITEGKIIEQGGPFHGLALEPEFMRTYQRKQQVLTLPSFEEFMKANVTSRIDDYIVTACQILPQWNSTRRGKTIMELATNPNKNVSTDWADVSGIEVDGRKYTIRYETIDGGIRVEDDEGRGLSFRSLKDLLPYFAPGKWVEHFCPSGELTGGGIADPQLRLKSREDWRALHDRKREDSIDPNLEDDLGRRL